MQHVVFSMCFSLYWVFQGLRVSPPLFAIAAASGERDLHPKQLTYRLLECTSSLHLNVLNFRTTHTVLRHQKGVLSLGFLSFLYLTFLFCFHLKLLFSETWKRTPLCHLWCILNLIDCHSAWPRDSSYQGNQ